MQGGDESWNMMTQQAWEVTCVASSTYIYPMSDDFVD